MQTTKLIRILAGLLCLTVLATLALRGRTVAPVIATAAAPAAGAAVSEPASDGLAAFVKRATPEPVSDISFKTEDGLAHTLADFKGKVVLLNLWATWCAPCRAEMPALDRLQAALGSDKFEVVALSVDRGGINASRKFLNETKVAHLKLYADGEGRAGGLLKVLGMPTTLLLNTKGEEVGRLIGPAEWDSPAAQALIKLELTK